MLRPATSDLLLARLAEEQSRHRLPSIVAGLVRGGELIWSAGRGVLGDGSSRPDARTQYRCGSISKTFVAVAVMRLHEAGQLLLEDPIGRHLDGCGLGDATVAEVLAHRSGLRAETAGPWWERTPGGSFEALTAGSLGDAARLLPVGERYHYSNVGFALLGELVARVRGAPYEQVLRSDILEPLGMSRTTARPVPPHARGLAVHPWADAVLAEPEEDAGAMAPAGQLWSTVTDLARWAGFLAGDVAGPLRPETLAAMRRPRALDDRPGQPWTTAYGLGLQLWNNGGRRAFGHSGSMPGFLATLRIDDPAGDGGAGDAVVIFTNATAGAGPSLAGDLLDILARCEPRLDEEWAPAGISGDVLALTGVWYWGPAPFALRARRDGMLELTPVEGTGRSSRFRAAGSDEWVGLDGYYAGEVLRPRHSGGRVVALELASFTFTRAPYDPHSGVPGGVDPGGWGPLP